MSCPKCGSDLPILRDDDDNLYRRLCPCEATEPCFACARGKVVVALLDRAGEVSKLACSKHGNEDSRTWLSQIHQEKKSTPEKVEKKDKGEKPEKRNVRPPAEKGSPNDVKRDNLPIYAGQCCGKNILSTHDRFKCPHCSKSVQGSLLKGGSMDGFYLTHGHGITSVIILMKIYDHGEYPAQDFVLSIP